MKRIAIAIALIFMFEATALAETENFSWTASPSADCAGYRLYWKDKATNALTKMGADIVGKATLTATRDIPVVEGTQTFAVIAKAYDLAGNESVASNEATKDGTAFVWKDTTAPAPPGMLQVLQQIAAALDKIADAVSAK